MSAAPTTIEKRKWDGSVSARWEGLLWTEDGGRTLWWTPAGTRRAHRRKGELEVTAHHEVTASTGAGWIATAVIGERGEVVRYEVDATVGDERVVDGVFGFVDLDLDLEIAGDRVEVQDLAEFAGRRREMGYPPEVMQAAIRSLGEVRELHEAGRWPFDGSLAATARRFAAG